MFFRNLRVFRLDSGWTYTAEALSSLLAKAAFAPAGPASAESVGFVPPTGIEGEYVVSVAGHQLFALCIETKIVPASVVSQTLAHKCKEFEEQNGYKPGRGAIREIKEVVVANLVARAFSRRQVLHVWVSLGQRWLGINTASAALADTVIEQLKRALDALPLLPLRTALSPSAAMTGWLACGEAPSIFSIDRDCTFRSQDRQQATVKYAHADLSDEAQRQIEHGLKAVSLAATWNDRISFVLMEDLSIKRLAFLDILKEQAEQTTSINDQEADLFQAELAIMGGELSHLLNDLVQALGGEVEA